MRINSVSLEMGTLFWIVFAGSLPAQTETGVSSKTSTNSIGMSLVRIEPGEFWMGTLPSTQEVADWFKAEGVEAPNASANGSRHKVRITKPFYMGKYEVTKAEFRKFVEATNYQTEAERRSTGGQGFNETASKWENGPQYTWQNTGWKPYDDTHPVVNVTWNDAQRFCKWLSHKDKIAYRLPTEAEWEYACRAGIETLFWNGDVPENLPQIANIPDGTAKERFPDWPTAIKGRDGYIFTAPVGTYPPNPWGLHDMLGNVAEFTADVFDFNAYRNRAGTTTVDPYITTGSGSRVHRGGHFYFRSSGVRSDSRASNPPNTAGDRVGFRVVAAPGP